MQIDLRIDGIELLRKLPKAERRLAFGTAAAINQTALEIQKEQRRNVRSRMTVRDVQFIERQAAVIKPFANAKQGRPFAEIAIGQRPRLLLSIFERGGTREPFKGKRVAVPITGGPARPTFRQEVPTEFEFRRLRLSKTRVQGVTRSGRNRRRAGGLGVRFGLEQTYQIPDVGVFQRQPDGTSRIVYAFVPPPRLRARLGFIPLARRVARRWFPEYMERQKIEALRRAGFR